jgi:hypothetical protein
MLGRRKHARFVLSKPVDASLRLRDEVAIERWDEREVVVLSLVSLGGEERMTMEIPGDAGRRMSVRVSESRPVVTEDGVIRHRLVLSIDGSDLEMRQSRGHES